jgi:hypothetical protein
MLVISRVNQHVTVRIAVLIHGEKLAEATVSCLGITRCSRGIESNNSHRVGRSPENRHYVEPPVWRVVFHQQAEESCRFCQYPCSRTAPSIG